jgi:hypothetical protein
MVETVRLCIVGYRVLPQNTSCTEAVLTNQKGGGGISDIKRYYGSK